MPNPLIALGAIGTVGSVVSANKAAKAQTEAAKASTAAQTDAQDKAIDYQKWALKQATARTAPYAATGNTANNALAYELGLRRTAPAGYRGFTETPAYQFSLGQGQNAINALAGSRGGIVSGRTMQDLTTFNQGLASQEYGNYLNRLSGTAGQGLNAATFQGNAAQNTASNVSNAYSNIGNAQAAGYSNIGNAQSAGAIGVGNALNTGLNNTLGILSYQGKISPSGNINLGGGLFGGNSWG